jgi:Mor transcription activator family
VFRRRYLQSPRRNFGGPPDMQRVVKEIIDGIGLADTIELIRGWGGRTLNVPMHMHAAHPLALRLGLESAARLVEVFKGQRLQLPAERSALLDMRNAAIWRACEEEGRSQQQVGLEYGLTRQGIAAVLQKMRDAQPVAGSNPERAQEESAA